MDDFGGQGSGLETLESLTKGADSSEVPQKVFYGHNLGNRVFLLKIPMYDFFRMSMVANERADDGAPVAQRKLDPNHAKKLAVYILRGLVSACVRRREQNGDSIPEAFQRIQQQMGRQPYIALQPIVANLRTCERDGSNLRGKVLSVESEAVGFKFWLGQRDTLWVVDGQHRRKAMDQVFQFLEDIRLQMKYPAKQSLFDAKGEVSTEELQVWMECYEVARGYCTIMVELHLGLGIIEERQLFHDLNNLAKKVESSLALEFDSANPVNRFIKEELIEKHRVDVVEKDVVNWAEDTGALARKDLVAVNAHLFLNKSNINGAMPSRVDPALPSAKAFWVAVTAIPHFGEEGAKQRTVAAQPVVLKALAKLTYDFAFGRPRNPEHLAALLDGITDIDFTHANPMWRYYDLTADERKQHGLAGLDAYLPTLDEGRNRDIGAYDPIAKVMRFGSKHNDIFPIIGDMVRWKLGLPSRRDGGEE